MPKPTYTAEDAYAKFVALEQVVRAAEGSNEATTRLRAIDTLLFEVLGWDRLSVETERYSKQVGFSDYACVQNNSVSLIVEAKKQDEYFLLPNLTFTDRPIAFGLLASECPAAEKALRQAIGYAATEGSRYVAISNGHQWLLALSFVQQQSISERAVYAFESVDAIKSRFRTFYDCFGPIGINSNLPASQLLESRKDPPPAKLSTRIINYPTPADRNSITNELSFVIDQVWDEMQKDEQSAEFLNECYVPPPASTDSLMAAKAMLEHRTRLDSDESVAAVAPSAVTELLSSYTPERPIIVLGRVGHGKSTFLRYLRLVRAKEALAKYIQLDLNFLDRPDSSNGVAEFVYKEIERQLLDNYQIDILEDKFTRQVLHGDLQRFQRTAEGKLHPRESPEYKRSELNYIIKLQSDLHDYLSKVFRLLKKGRSWSVAIFFDNLDRRDDAIQEEAFLRSSAIARDWSALVFVCLRPGTFYRSKEQGVLDSVAPRVITVNSPGSQEVLHRRFGYAIKMASGQRPLSAQRRFGSNVTVDLPRVRAFLQCALDSFGPGSRLVTLFDAVSNGNVRDILKYVRTMITARHLDTTKIIAKLNRAYRIPEHEALRAMIFGDFHHYDPSQSVFINLFDINRADQMEHFGRILVLAYLRRQSVDTASQGFCRTEGLIQYLCQMGFSEEHARLTVEFLHDKKCCESRVHGLLWKEIHDELRITSLGAYHINELAVQFQYVDAMIVDTPVLDEAVRRKMVDSQSISERLNRVVAFIEYLDTCSSSLKDRDAISLWKDVHTRLVADVEQVRWRAQQSRSGS